MLANESGEDTNFGLPDEVLQALPSDPFQQLDVARKITSIALSTRVSELESESSDLRAGISERDQLVADLRSQVDSLDSSLSDAADKLAAAEQEKENLVKENEALSDRVKKLTRDVSKLEVFRKTLMQSLQEEDLNSAAGRQPQIIAKPTPNDDDASLPPSRSLSVRSQSPETGNSYEGHEPEAPKTSMSTSFPLSSQATTPRITPPGSPPTVSASASPTRTSKPASPRRHAMSFSTSRGMFDDKNNSGRTRVDGKEFFRQVRSRLSYEQFGAFLANVKELNAQKQTREETLQKAEEIFGTDNKDLYVIFEGLITRNVH